MGKPPVKLAKMIGPPEIILSMQFWERVFPEAMRRLRMNREEPEGRRDTLYSIRDSETWDDAYDRLEACRAKYLDDKGWTKKVKREWRAFSDNIGPIQEAWKLVPDVDYITPIRGAVEFIFEAIKRASETRQKVVQGLDKLDSVLEAGTELVVSVLAAVEKLIGFYVKSRGRKVLSSVFKGQDYEKDVVSSLYDITTKSEALRDEAMKADMSQSAKNWRAAEQRHEELRKTLNNGQIEILQRQAGLKADTEQIGGGLNSIYSLLVEYEKNQREHNAALQKRNEELERGYSDLKHINHELQRSLTPIMGLGSKAEWRIEQDDLWAVFRHFIYEDDDMKYIIEKEDRLPSHERAATERLASTPRFRQWMVSPASKELLIQGNLTGGRQISALSVFCSTFTSTVRRRQKYISLVHFCGLHADLYHDADAGPKGMMMSFIAQLLQQWKFDTSFLHEYVDVSWFKCGEDPSTEDLNGLSKWLIRQLPSDQTVFFVIDGVHNYEKDVYIEALISSTASILDTTLDEGVNATVKILMVSPCRTVEVREGFHHDAVMLLMEEPGASSDASSRRFEHQFARALEIG
ncbi:hypothetical protein EKO27_g6380 [Xylaria grammica]|uniref:Nephrocystin 3-like N-terminal domain-containing protein n=1 Tax=Xylaria grammica TaxID=363999 RepID=A0A439D380_9PEZI|nr:hypothetical protein EKO27_g6380 [Xylaria grammica]